MAIDVEIGDVSVQLLPSVIGQVANGQKIGRAVKSQPVVIVQALGGLDLLRHGPQPGIVNVGQHAGSGPAQVIGACIRKHIKDLPNQDSLNQRNQA